MRKVTKITEHFQHFVQEMQDSFWGDVYGRTKLLWKKFWEAESARERDRYLGCGWHQRGREPGREYRNGFYWRSFETVLGTVRLGIARSRTQGFLPRGMEAFQRRAPELVMLIREAFLRGLSGARDGQFADRAGERADSVAADAKPGPGGESLSPGAAERRGGRTCFWMG